MKLVSSSDTYDDALEMLNDLSPSKLDLEIRQLITEDEIVSVLNFIEYGLEEKLCFELVQALLHVVLKVHSEEIIESEILLSKTKELQEKQNDVWERLENIFHYNQCLITHLS